MATTNQTVTPKTNKSAAKPAPAAPAAKPARGGELRNGIRRPTGHGVVRMMWDAFDEGGKPLTTEQLSEMAEGAGWNRNLLGSHHRQWRKWNGIAAPKPVKEKKAVKA